MTLQEIQTNMTNILSEYLKDTVLPEKYFFLDKEYFFEYQKLSYNFFPLSNEEKKEINTLSKSSFKNFEFSLIKDSVKNNCNLKKFDETKSNKFKSITKEYLLYFLLKEKNSNKTNIQKSNFLYTYINELFDSSSLEISKLLEKEFELYLLSSSSKNLLKKIEEDTKIYKKDIDKIEFLERYKNLYTKKEYTEKLNFYYQIDETKSQIFQDLLGVYSLPSKDMELFYRGQSNSKYGINASLSRSDKLSYFEDELYYEILSLKPFYFKEDKSVYENLITMQHFGLPTRLIDLSRNALISLYFACSGEEEKDGAVYVIPALKDKILNFDDKRLNCLNDLIKKSNKDIKTIEDYCKDCTQKDKSNCKSGEILKKSYIVKGLAKNERITNQSGDFIFVGIDDKSKCAKNISSEDVNVEKILIIDYKSKDMVLQELKQFNIHTGTVYPDLQNMSSHLKSEFEKRDLPPKNLIKEDTQTIESEVIITSKAMSLSPNEAFNDISFEEFYRNFKGSNKKYKEKLENLYPSFSRYICNLNEDSLIEDIKDSLKGYKPYKDKIKLKRVLYSILNSLKVIAYLKSVNSLRITIVENSYDWKGYFADKNNTKVTVYNENDLGVESCELQKIESEGLVVTIKEKDSLPTKYLNFDKLISFTTEYDGIILIMDYKDKPLFEDYFGDWDYPYTEPVED